MSGEVVRVSFVVVVVEVVKTVRKKMRIVPEGELHLHSEMGVIQCKFNFYNADDDGDGDDDDDDEVE